jgi:polyisoprenoid-binding protein YceI
MKRRYWVLSAFAVVLIVGAVGVWYFFIRDTSPAQVSLADAVAKATTSTAATNAASSEQDPSTAAPSTSARPEGTATSAAPSSLDGVWQLKAGSENFAGFRIQEELAGFGGKTVVGRTPGVTGTMTLAGNTVTGAKIEADMTGITTDSDQRNRAIRTRGLETNTYPTATFTQTAPLTLPKPPTEGEAIEATITGDLLVHGVTRALDIPIKAQLTGDTVVVVVEPFQVAIADFAIEKPLVPGQVLAIADTAQFELQLFFVKSET